LRRALDAFCRLDADTAYEVIAADVEVDNAYDAVVGNAGAATAWEPDMWLNTLWTARALERIGDHAKNLCEHVVYIVKGKDVRHSGSIELG